MDGVGSEDLVSLLAIRGLPLGKKGRLYSTCVRSFMLYGSETRPVKEEDQIRYERNDARVAEWICNVGPEDKISAEECRSRLKLQSMR